MYLCNGDSAGCCGRDVFFAALHCMLRLIGDRKAVRPSVKRVNCDKTKETSAQMLIPYERTMHLVLRQEGWLVGDVPFYLKFWAKSTHPFKNGNFQSIFACSTSTVTPSKKVQL